MVFHAACTTTHFKLLAGKCPWCGCFVFEGKVIDAEQENAPIIQTVVHGQTLKQLVETCGPLTPEAAARYICLAAEYLSHLHASMVVHRNIHPQTIVLAENGDVTIVNSPIRQFHDGSLVVTSNEDLIGMADYLAPEQALTDTAVDGRADVYSLGCTLYYLLCGHAPYPDGTLAERLMKHQTADPRAIADIRPDVPERLVEICSRMMAKQPRNRYQRADEVATTLSDWLAEGG